jgi:hypothetical protein
MTHHLDDLPELSHTSWKLTQHLFNLVSLKLIHEEQGVALPRNFQAEIERTSKVLSEVLAREHGGDGAGARPQYPRPPSFSPTPPSTEPRRF